MFENEKFDEKQIIFTHAAHSWFNEYILTSKITFLGKKFEYVNCFSHQRIDSNQGCTRNVSINIFDNVFQSF